MNRLRRSGGPLGGVSMAIRLATELLWLRVTWLEKLRFWAVRWWRGELKSPRALGQSFQRWRGRRPWGMKNHISMMKMDEHG